MQTKAGHMLTTSSTPAPKAWLYPLFCAPILKAENLDRKKKVIPGAGEMAQSVKDLPLKQYRLDLSSQHPHKKASMMVYAYDTSVGEAEAGGSLWLTSQLVSMNW